MFCVFATMAFAESYINDFLSLDADIRASSMGGCRMISSGAAALFGNPARISESDSWAFASHEQLYQGLLISDAVGVSFDSGENKRFAIGALYAGGGGIKVTALPDPSQPVSAKNRPYEVAEKGHHDIALVPGFAVRIRDDLYAGASGAIIYRQLVDNSAWGGALSLGAAWYPVNGLCVGATARNASFVFWNTEEGTSELGAPSLGLSASYSAKLGYGFASALCVEGQYLPQEAVFEAFTGGEISYADLIALRCGLNNNKFTAGADIGIVDGLRVGAAFALHSDLPLSYRIGATIERRNASGE